MKTVRVTYQLVREFGLTTILGEAVALADAVGAPVWAAPSLEKDAPVSRAVDRAGHILSRPTLGGLHHQYARI